MPMHSAMLQPSAHEYAFFCIECTVTAKSCIQSMLTLVNERLQIEIWRETNAVKQLTVKCVFICHIFIDHIDITSMHCKHFDSLFHSDITTKVE